MDLGHSLIQDDLILRDLQILNYIYKESSSKEGYIHRFSGLGYEHNLWGATIQPTTGSDSVDKIRISHKYEVGQKRSLLCKMRQLKIE